MAGTKDVHDPAARKGVTRITDTESDPIAAELKKLYNDAAKEPLPDELTRLLDQLDAAERKG